MLVAEFFALNFKLKMVHIRSEKKRIAYKKATGIDIIPRPESACLFRLFYENGLPHCYRHGIYDSLGYFIPAQKWICLPKGVIVLCISFFARDLCGLIYIYFNSGFYVDPAENKREWEEELREADVWDRVHLPLAASAKYYWEELISDIVLQVYAFMLFTSFWKYINQTGMEMLQQSLAGQGDLPKRSDRHGLISTCYFLW